MKSLGSPMKKFRVSNENHGVSNENPGVSNENMGSRMNSHNDVFFTDCNKGAKFD